MKASTPQEATAIAAKLKAIISKYQHRSFTAHISYLANHHIRQGTGQVKLKSPVRQVMYLMSLYHSTPMDGKELYGAGSEDHRQIIRLLNQIERSYSQNTEDKSKNGISMEEFNRKRITYGTFMNYYFNATLSYIEQDIERIKRTFIHHSAYILEETKVALQEYIDFFLLLNQLEIERLQAWDNHNLDQADPVLQKLFRLQGFSRLTEREKLYVFDHVDRKVFALAIPMQDIYQRMEEQKAKQLLAYFTLLRKDDPDYLYYTDECAYLKKPILIMDGRSILMPYSKQLINSIYDFLYEVCNEPDAPGRKISERRDSYLEEKTTEVFRDFFGPEAIFHQSYYVSGEEKDLLILNQKSAYIIECKAHKQRPPLRDPEKAYARINDDFQKSVGKGYDQASKVEELFHQNLPFSIKDKKGKPICTIDPAQYEEIFTIVITQERLGQIQCDLGLLLKVKEDSPYPWSVCINDLETFLITLKRKENPTSQFDSFLMLREQLHERVASYDELELCAYFLFDNEKFTKNCQKTGIFISQPDVDQFFDLLYYTGLGLKDEFNLAEKVKREHLHNKSVIKFHKLKPAERVAELLAKPTI